MPFHWCADETLALLAMLPFIGYYFNRLHLWWHAKFQHKCHEDHCDNKHAVHVTHDELVCDHGKTTHETCSDCPDNEWATFETVTEDKKPE